MIRAALPYLLTAIVAVILRDAEVFLAAKLFCWRKRRQTQRHAQQQRIQRERELQEQAARIAAMPKAAASTIPFPDLLNGPLMIEADSFQDVTITIREVVANLRWQRKTVCSWDQNVEN